MQVCILPAIFKTDLNPIAQTISGRDLRNILASGFAVINIIWL